LIDRIRAEELDMAAEGEIAMQVKPGGLRAGLARFRRSRDGGRTWRETPIGGPFDLRTAPYIPPGLNLPGYFLGEYQGLTAVTRGFLATFPQASPRAQQGMTDGFAARIHIR
jgi:hypothetical protein